MDGMSEVLMAALILSTVSIIGPIPLDGSPLKVVPLQWRSTLSGLSKSLRERTAT
jgi:hypothetical protein